MSTNTVLNTFKIAKGTKAQILTAYDNGDISSTDFAIATDEDYVTSSELSTVATSGSYEDLSDKPYIPTATSDLTNDSGYITGITSSDVTSALGYTPYNSTNPSGYQENVIETVKVNGTALTPTNKAVDITVPSAVTESTVSGWGFTKNIGTVTSVNNTQPDANGNVTISTGGNYTAGSGIDITNDVISVDNTVALKSEIPVIEAFTAAEVQAIWNGES